MKSKRTKTMTPAGARKCSVCGDTIVLYPNPGGAREAAARAAGFCSLDCKERDDDE